MIVDKPTLSDVIGKSTRVIESLTQKGLPVHSKTGGDRRGNQYDTVAVITWLIQLQMQKLQNKTSDGCFKDLETERARLTHHQANKSELEEYQLRGKLIPADIVKDVQSNMVSAFRARCLSIPTKAAHAVMGLTDLNEAQEILRTYVYEALNELASYNPTDYGIVVVHSDDSKAAPETDGEPVGGHEPAPIERVE